MKFHRNKITICGGKPKRLWRAALAAALLLSFAVPALAEETIVETLDRLEKAEGLTADPTASLPQRISVLEQRAFGAEQQGPYMERVERLKETLQPKAPDRINSSDSSELSIQESLPAGGADASLSDVLPLLDAVPPNFLRIEPPGTRVDAHLDYLPTVLEAGKGKTLHFKYMPIPVYISSFPDRNFVSCVVRGFEAWEDRTSGAVRFVQVDDPAKARIQVAWKHLGREADNAGCALGAHTITKYSPNSKANPALFVSVFGPKYTVPPEVIEVNLDLIMGKNPGIRYRLLQNVVTHELGHALGLLGHSKNTDDMMYTITDEHSRLSPRDVNTLIKLYQRKPDVAL